MSKLFSIIKREYWTRVRGKGFIIGTIISPVLMMSFAFVPVLIARAGGPDKVRVVVLDQNGDANLYARLEKLLEPAGLRDDRYELEREAIAPGEGIQAKQAQLNQRITTGKLDGYLILPPDLLAQEQVRYHVKNVGGSSGQLRDAVNKAIFESRVARAGLDAERIRELNKTVRLDVVNTKGERERGQTFILSFGLLMIIYITILVYGVTVMRGVIEEKQSRIIEVLLSSVRPFELMLGKIIGIGAVGLTQYFIWAFCGALISTIATLPALATGAVKIPQISAVQIIFFVVYFVLGYFLYATFYAMVGAIVSSEEDGQQIQMPVTMTLVVPVMVSSLVMRNPDGLPATILSLVPFFSPVLMFLRIGLQMPPWWQIALSLVLMVGTILGSVWLAAKIYRVGVLMYGKRPTIPELIKWLRYT